MKTNYDRIAKIQLMQQKPPAYSDYTSYAINLLRSAFSSQPRLRIHTTTILLLTPRIMAHGDELLDHKETVCRAKHDEFAIIHCVLICVFMHLQTLKYSKSMNIRPRKDEFSKINAQNIVRISDSFWEPIIQLNHLSCNF